MRPRLLVFLAVFQSILLAAHFMVFETWLHFWGAVPPSTTVLLRVATALLAFSFLASSLQSFKYWNSVTRIFYRISAVWLGLFTSLFLPALGGCRTRLTSKVAGAQWRPRSMT